MLAMQIWLFRVLKPVFKFFLGNRAVVLTRIFSDYRPAVDAVYVFAQTEENQLSAIRAVSRVCKKGLARIILGCEGNTETGYIGFPFIKQHLLQLGVPEDRIQALVMPWSVNVNTYSESQYLVRHAKKNGWHSIYVSTAPFHQPRAFISAVSAALREYPELKIYSLPGDTLPWDEHVRHSQGRLEGTRQDLILAEVLAILQYRLKGDLVSFKRVVGYFKSRDR